MRPLDGSCAALLLMKFLRFTGEPRVPQSFRNKPRPHGRHHTAHVHGHMLRSAHGPMQRTTSKYKAHGVYHVYKAVSMVKGINIIQHNKQTWVSAGYDD